MKRSKADRVSKSAGSYKHYTEYGAACVDDWTYKSNKALLNSRRHAYAQCYNCIFYKNFVCTNDASGDFSIKIIESQAYLFISEYGEDCRGYAQINKETVYT